MHIGYLNSMFAKQGKQNKHLSYLTQPGGDIK